MHLTKALAAALLFSCLTHAQANPGKTPPSVQIPAEFETLLRSYERAWTAKDAAALARLFFPGGMALPNGSPPAVGNEAIAAEYAKNAGGPLALRAIAFTQSRDLAYMVGGFSQSSSEPDMGKFVLVLRLGADGKWLIAADIDNLNFRPSRPPAQPASSASRPQ
ncbi:YybH family protein [Aquabacterium sp.]|uniref:YybH family protein n=1 Tax=Aquabacterium sp. TaxID=1872578 RepID=UPI002BC34F1B|nr:DUF4440 domain-containing protein [Aquabacterium sp.]HSW06482.1 DUF4440 domain-containing protein [Aquabacterium sp.]